MVRFNDGPEPRWEPPLVEPLFVTLRRACELLNLPYWRSYELSYILDSRYAGEKGGAIRVSLQSVREHQELTEAGQPAGDILATIYGERHPSYSARLFFMETGMTSRSATYWSRRAMRR